MNAVADNPDEALRADPPSDLEIARILFAIDILEQRSSSAISGYLWRIKLKVARHVHRVLVRRTGVSGLEILRELSRTEQEELLKTHPLLQTDWCRPDFALVETDWRLDSASKAARFAERVRSWRHS